MADLRPKRIAEFIEPLRVTPGRRVIAGEALRPRVQGRLRQEEARGPRSSCQQGVELLSEYQERLAAQDTHGVVVVLQALDAAGKDGTIRHVMSGVNPQGVSVHSFKAPSSSRARPRLPVALRRQSAAARRDRHLQSLLLRGGPGGARAPRDPQGSAVAPARARGRDVWKKRYRDINDWERYLTDNGFTIVKLLLNLSKEEQRARFLRRIDLPDHNWKFSAADVSERSYWDDYQKAFSEMLSTTSTEWAPWYVIPADHKWFARICASAVIADALIKIDPQLPQGDARSARRADGDQGAAGSRGARRRGGRSVRGRGAREGGKGRRQGRQERQEVEVTRRRCRRAA